MNPFYILGWMVVASIALYFIFIFSVLAAKGWLSYVESRERKRADAGKVACQYVDSDREWCTAIATRRTSTGYYCNDHCQSKAARGYGSFSFSSPLEHTIRRLKD